MIAVNGFGSSITQALLELLPAGETWTRWPLPGPMPAAYFNRAFFAQGVLHGRSASEHDDRTAAETFAVNCLDIMAALDQLFAVNPDARAVVLASESGYAGSYDTAYAAAKAGLCTYVETKRLGPGQQLVAISPGIIGDASMTLRRDDQHTVRRRAAEHPKRRHVTSVEVARLARFLLYEDRGYISGTVVRMHGGESAWR